MTQDGTKLITTILIGVNFLEYVFGSGALMDSISLYIQFPCTVTYSFTRFTQRLSYSRFVPLKSSLSLLSASKALVYAASEEMPSNEICLTPT
jgi:hypothetical protein